METSPLFKELPPIVEGGKEQAKHMEGLWHDLNIFFLITRKFRILFLAVFLISAVVTFWYFTAHTSYSAKARFIIRDWSQPYNAATGPSMYTPEKVNQLLMLFLSDSVTQYIIQKYHLDSNITGTNANEDYQRLQAGIATWISLEQSAFNSFNLTVTTSDRILSANIANEVVSKVSALSRKMYANDISGRIQVLKSMLSLSSGGDSLPDDLLLSSFGKIQNQLKEISADQQYSEKLKPVFDQLGILEKQYDDKLVQLRMNELMLKQISEQGSAGSITLVQRATPDFANYFINHLVYAIALALAICSLLPFVIYLSYRIRGKDWVL